MIYQMLKKIKILGVIFGSSGKGITEKQNGRKILNMSWEMINTVKKERVISDEKVTKQCRKMPYWKAPGKDSVQGYWIKNLGNLHERIAIQLNKVLMGDYSLTA